LGRGTEAHPGNMFVPIDRLKPVLADLLALGRPGDPTKPWLGINAAPGEEGGVVVTRVSQEGPAEKAGIVHGDRVVAVAGKPVNSLAELWRQVWSQGTAGVTVPLTVLHGGKRIEVGVPSIDRYRYLKLDASY
jgi:S1-C subfamily serine protease